METKDLFKDWDEAVALLKTIKHLEEPTPTDLPCINLTATQWSWKHEQAGSFDTSEILFVAYHSDFGHSAEMSTPLEAVRDLVKIATRALDIHTYMTKEAKGTKGA